MSGLPSDPGVDFDTLDPSAQMAYLKDGYDALVLREQRNDARIARGERQRVTIFVVVALATFIALAGFTVAVYNTWSGHAKTAVRNAQHDATVKQAADTQRQIRMLACTAVQFAPPGNQTTDRLRAQYHCPPFGGHLAP